MKRAQLNKLDALIEKAGIRKSDHVLEVGCGWGSMAIHAVQVRLPPNCTNLTVVHVGHASLLKQEPVGSWSRTPAHAMLWRRCVRLCGRCAFLCQDSRAALQRTGCSWTGLTVSKQQLEEAVVRVQAAGLSNSIRLLFCDYREGQALGQFDKVCLVCWRAHPRQGSAYDKGMLRRFCCRRMLSEVTS